MNPQELKQFLTEHMPGFTDKAALRAEIEKDKDEFLTDLVNCARNVFERQDVSADLKGRLVVEITQSVERRSSECMRCMIFKFLFGPLPQGITQEQMLETHKCYLNMDNCDVLYVFDDVMQMKLEPLNENQKVYDR